MNRESVQLAERFADASVELAARRTGMAFERTRLAADRTLMAAIRTSLSLISFGFTIFQVFHQLTFARAFADGRAPRDFGLALVALGLVMLMLGIAQHLRFMRTLRAERDGLVAQELAHGSVASLFSSALATAVALWMVGVISIASMAVSIVR